MFDGIEKEIFKWQDPNKIKFYLQSHKNGLTDGQYKFLSEFTNSITDRDKLQDRRDAKRNAFTLKLEKFRMKKKEESDKRKSPTTIGSVLGIPLKDTPENRALIEEVKKYDFKV